MSRVGACPAVTGRNPSSSNAAVLSPIEMPRSAPAINAPYTDLGRRLFARAAARPPPIRTTRLPRRGAYGDGGMTAHSGPPVRVRRRRGHRTSTVLGMSDIPPPPPPPPEGQPTPPPPPPPPPPAPPVTAAPLAPAGFAAPPGRRTVRSDAVRGDALRHRRAHSRQAPRGRPDDPRLDRHLRHLDVRLVVPERRGDEEVVG